MRRTSSRTCARVKDAGRDRADPRRRPRSTTRSTRGCAEEGSPAARSARWPGRSSSARASSAPTARRSRPIVASGANGALAARRARARSRSSARRSSCSTSARSSAATAPTARARSRRARATTQMMEVYEVVLRAQEAALALVRPGQDCHRGARDRAARDRRGRLRRVLQPRHRPRRRHRDARGAALPQRLRRRRSSRATSSRSSRACTFQGASACASRISCSSPRTATRCSRSSPSRSLSV